MRHAHAGGIAQGCVQAFDLGTKLRAKWEVGVSFSGGYADEAAAHVFLHCLSAGTQHRVLNVTIRQVGIACNKVLHNVGRFRMMYVIEAV